MRPVLSVFAVSLAMFALLSCSDYQSPTAPGPTPIPTPIPKPTPPVSNGSFTGNIMDVDTHRACIENGRAEMIAGPFSGTVYLQNQQLCEDPGAGFVINDLPVGVVITLRVAAPGYLSAERDFLIVGHGGSVDINLKRAG